MKIVPPIVLKFLYHLIHSIYTLYEFILDVWIIVIKLFDTFKDTAPWLDHQILVIGKLKQRLKIPVSISLVVSSEELDNFELLVNKLGQLIHWSVSLNVQHISVFDETGFLMHRRHEVLRRIEKFALPLNNKCSESNLKVKIKNGCIEPYYTLQVPGQENCALRFLSNDDGRRHLIKIARKLCHRYSTKSPSSDDNYNESRSETHFEEKKHRTPLVHLDMMCDAVKSDYNFPDPELIVRTSSTASIFSFCPWQMRLSEIVFLPDHPSLYYVSKIIPSLESRLLFQDFVNSISRFSSCQQRFGK